MDQTMEIPTAGPGTYCRLCLGRDDLLNVFTVDDRLTKNVCGKELVEKICKCTNIKLTVTVDVGYAICRRCLQAVEDFYHFRVRSNKVNDLIQETTVALGGTHQSVEPPKPPTVTTGGRKHHCRYCPKSFRTLAGLTEHGNRAHVAARQHHCPNCLAQFQHAPSLARHLRSRRCFAFTKFRCRVCSESYIEREQWADHIRVHAKDYPHQCPDCWSQFKHKATLRRHVNTVHLLMRL